MCVLGSQLWAEASSILCGLDRVAMYWGMHPIFSFLAFISPQDFSLKLPPSPVSWLLFFLYTYFCFCFHLIFGSASSLQILLLYRNMFPLFSTCFKTI